jgi:hypothetical protein
MKAKYLVLVLIIAALNSCKKDAAVIKSKTDTTTTGNNTGNNKPAGPQFLVIGNSASAASPSVATLWRNGKATYLADSTVQSQATAIAVVDTNVYIVGTVNYVATIWKNGVATALSGGDMANGLAISGNDVYVVGDTYLNTLYVATLWKNGTPTYLTDVNTEAFPSDVAVNGSDVYVAGNIYSAGGFNTLTLWKNGSPGTIATNCVSGYGPSYITGSIHLALLGNDVYITGAVENKTGDELVATLWKNGTPQSLTDGSKSAAINGIATSGGKIYTAGYYDSMAVYWTGTSQTNISPINLQYTATAITVYGGYVYAAGYAGYSTTSAAYWKGNSPVQLSNKPSVATGIAVFAY